MDISVVVPLFNEEELSLIHIYQDIGQSHNPDSENWTIHWLQHTHPLSFRSLREYVDVYKRQIQTLVLQYLVERIIIKDICLIDFSP